MPKLQSCRHSDKNNFTGLKNADCSPLLLGEHNVTSQNIYSHSLPINDCPITLYTDWVEFTAKVSPVGLIPKKHSDLSLKQLETGTQYFKKICEIHLKGEKIGTMEIEPRVSFIPADIIKIKLDNRINYSHELEPLINQILNDFNLVFKNYTRIDYAIDFQAIEGFESPQDFLQEIILGTIVMKRKEMSIHRKSTGYITGISFGKRISGLKITIYDKSEELKKSNKTYISDCWKQAGFDLDKPVYRLEYSCRKPRYEALTEDGETIGTFNEVSFISCTKKYTTFLVHTNQFYRPEKCGNTRRSKGFAIVMKDAINTFKRVYSLVKNQATNMKKTILKHLAMEALFFQKAKQRVKASACWELIRSMAAKYNLKEWFDNAIKYLEIEESEFTAMDCFMTRQLKDLKLLRGTFVQPGMF